MWFSSGNTSSVTHTDDYENILCIIAGRKDLIMVDYYKYEEIANVSTRNLKNLLKIIKNLYLKVIIDIYPGSYSSMDVDKYIFKF